MIAGALSEVPGASFTISMAANDAGQDDFVR